MKHLERKVPSILSLLTIFEQGSVNRAAKVLNISQPALTRNIQKLEQTLQAPLLERSAKGVTLTAFGAAVVERAQLIKAELRNLAHELESLKGNSAGQIRLGATPMILTHFLPAALEALHLNMPSIGIQVEEGTRPRLLSQLRLGDLDVVIAPVSFDGEETDVSQESLFALELLVVVKTRHPLVSRSDLTLLELAGHDWIVPRADSSFHRRLDRDFRKAGATFPKSGIEISSPSATKALVEATDLIAILPARTVKDELRSGALVALQGDWTFETRTAAAFLRQGSRPVSPIRALIAHLKLELQG